MPSGFSGGPTSSISVNAEFLHLNRLPRKSLFKVVADFIDGEVSLSARLLYRLASTMADSGKTLIVEEVVAIAEPPGTYVYRWDTPIRISRESARTIEGLQGSMRFHLGKDYLHRQAVKR